VVCGVHHGILEATRVRKVQMKLAVLALVRSNTSRAYIGLERIKPPRDYLFKFSLVQSEYGVGVVRGGWGEWGVGGRLVQDPNNSTYGLIVRGRSRDRALRTSTARVGGVTNSNLVCWRCNSTRLRIGSGENRKNESSDLGMHLEELMNKSGDKPSEW
jgi:hypothetical protein